MAFCIGNWTGKKSPEVLFATPSRERMKLCGPAALKAELEELSAAALFPP